MNTLEIKREKIKMFLLKHSHYPKQQLVLGAKNRGLFSVSESDEEVYLAIKRFAEYHNIKIEQVRKEVKKKPKKEYIEELDEDGNSVLKKLNVSKMDMHLKQLLEEKRERLSAELLEVNRLLKFYE